VRGSKFEAKMLEFDQRLGKDEAKSFELGLETLGELLGFESVRRTDAAAPDGVWRDGEAVWFVFEAKTEEKPKNPISTREVRQALTHPTWVASNLGWEEPKEIVNAIIAYKKQVESTAASVADRLCAMQPDVVRGLAHRVVSLHREIRGRARGLSDEALAAQFADGFPRSGLSTASLMGKLGRYRVAKL
jgi:hypothetical protein